MPEEKIESVQDLYTILPKWKVPSSLSIYINFVLLNRAIKSWDDPLHMKNKLKAYKTYLDLWIAGKSTKSIDELVSKNNKELVNDSKKAIRLKEDQTKKTIEELIVDSMYLITRHPFVSSIGDIIIDIRSRTNGVLKVEAEEWYVREYIKLLSEQDKPKDKTKPILFPIP